MFNKKDVLIGSVQKVMQENAKRREAEAAVNAAFGVTSRRAIPAEGKAKYDAALAEATSKVLTEGTERIDEISMKLAQNYISKSKESRASTRKTLDKQQRSGPVTHVGSGAYNKYVGNSGKSNGELEKTIAKRKEGTRLATKKLTGSAKVIAKEENIQEVSRQLLQRYVNKARPDAIKKGEEAAKAGKTTDAGARKPIANRLKGVNLARKKIIGKSFHEDIDTIKEEIKGNLVKRMNEAQAQGEEALKAFTASLTEEQAEILGFNEAWGQGAANNAGRPDMLTPGTKIAPPTARPRQVSRPASQAPSVVRAAPKPVQPAPQVWGGRASTVGGQPNATKPGVPVTSTVGAKAAAGASQPNAGSVSAVPTPAAVVPTSSRPAVTPDSTAGKHGAGSVTGKGTATGSAGIVPASNSTSAAPAAKPATAPAAKPAPKPAASATSRPASATSKPAKEKNQGPLSGHPEWAQKAFAGGGGA